MECRIVKLWAKYADTFLLKIQRNSKEMYGIKTLSGLRVKYMTSHVNYRLVRRLALEAQISLFTAKLNILPVNLQKNGLDQPQTGL